MGVISFKSLGFSVLGIFFGMIVALILNVLLRQVIFIESQNSLTYDLTTASIIAGLSFGILTPLIANYWPIKESMNQSLRNSLDLSRSKSADVVGIKI